MIKEVPCLECDGKGFIAKFDEYSAWSERCPNCGGTGTVKVPMTNADRIRAMSDEELAMYFADMVNEDIYDGPGEWLVWLQKPAQEERECTFRRYQTTCLQIKTYTTPQTQRT